MSENVPFSGAPDVNPDRQAGHQPDHQRLGSAEIAGILRRQIGSGELPPRERLPAERRLAELYGVARGTVRAALNQLEGEGLVETRSGSGTYVCYEEPQSKAMESVISEARPLELMDARFALEPHICRLAVLHARSEDLRRASELLEIMEASVHDPDGFANADMEFHKLLAEITGNGLLRWMLFQISDVRDEDEWTKMRTAVLNPDSITLYNRQHRAILEAIKAREAERAARLMKEHLETARLSLTRAAQA